MTALFQACGKLPEENDLFTMIISVTAGRKYSMFSFNFIVGMKSNSQVVDFEFNINFFTSVSDNDLNFFSRLMQG